MLPAPANVTIRSGDNCSQVNGAGREGRRRDLRDRNPNDPFRVPVCQRLAKVAASRVLATVVPAASIGADLQTRARRR